MPPRQQPQQQQSGSNKPLTRNEIQAINAAKDIKDTQPQQNKLAMRKQLRALVKVLQEEKRLLAFYQQQ